MEAQPEYMNQGVSPNFLTMLLARAVVGIGEAGYYPAGTALMSDYFSRSTPSRG